MRLLKKIIRNVMTLINTFRVTLSFGIFLALLNSWETKNFFFLLLSIALVLLALVLNFQRFRSITLPATALALILTAAEPLIPLFIPSFQLLTQITHEAGKNNSSDRFNQRVPGFGYHPIPGVHSIKKLTLNQEIIYDVVYTIGSDGYRKDVTTESYDAYIYGGSFTFGEGLNDDETLSAFLNTNHGIFTKNVGAHGYGMHQALYNLQNGVTADQPYGINILLTTPYHALRSSCKPSYTGGTPRFIFESGTLKQYGVCRGGGLIYSVINRSNIIKLVKSAIGNEGNTISDDDVELYIEIIKEIKRISVANEAELVIAYLHVANENLTNTSWTTESIFIELSTIADAVIDVTLAETRSVLDPKFYIHELDTHPSGIANEHRAALLSKIFD